ncbi:hypothetical protein ACFWHV_05550 [Streptomyces collinus]|uniref:hypothetical protein n=1 Tax=Streptomyces collinus TaxID=42684 RepID=UPI00364C34BC
MGFRGFDAAKLTTLAGHLDTLAQNSGKLHSQLAAVLTTAQQNLPSEQNASRDSGPQDLVGDVVPCRRSSGTRACPVPSAVNSVTCSRR